MGRMSSILIPVSNRYNKKTLNEKFKGNFIEGDKVILSALRDKLLSGKKMAQSYDPQIFIESIFPKAFGMAAQDGYMEAPARYGEGNGDTFCNYAFVENSTYEK